MMGAEEAERRGLAAARAMILMVPIMLAALLLLIALAVKSLVPDRPTRSDTAPARGDRGLPPPDQHGRASLLQESAR